MCRLFCCILAGVSVMVLLTGPWAADLRATCCEFFDYRKAISVQPGRVVGGPHSNFPLLVRCVDTGLRSRAYGGNVESPSGYDIAFRALDDTTCGGAGLAPCTLDHEIEKYDPTMGEVVAWVKVPSINNGTVIYLYYGSPEVTSSLENPAGVWNAGPSGPCYKGVWHLPEDGSGQAAVEILRPSGAGDETGIGGANPQDAQWPTTGEHWDKLDDGTADENATFIVAATSISQRDLYHLSDSTAAGAINSVKVYYRYQVPGGTTFYIRSAIKTNGTVYQAAERVVGASPWTEASDTWTTNPSTGTAWTWAQVNALQAGVRMRTVGNISIVTQVYVKVNYTPSPLNLFRDSTSGGNHGSDFVSATGKTGRIGNGQDFDGSDDYTDHGDNLDMGTNDFTISCWLRTDTATGHRMLVGKKSVGFGVGYGFYLNNNNRLYGHIGDNTGYTGTTNDGAQLATATWYYATVVFDRDGNITRYLNGSTYGTADSTVRANSLDNSQMFKFATEAGGSYFNGILDEVRVSNCALSAGWIRTEYENQADPATFHSCGAEEYCPPTAITLTSFEARDYQGLVHLQWATGYEVKNLGFRLYREENGRRAAVTRSLVAGSALFAGRTKALTAGRSYSWWDVVETAGVRYWLEEVDLSGKSSWHGPVTAAPGGPGLPQPVQSLLLSQVGKGANEAAWAGPDSRAAGAAPRTGAARVELSPQPASQWGLAGQSAVKIGVGRTGWHRVGQAQLLAAGLSPEVDPRKLQLYADGVQQAIVVRGEEDGRLDAGDWIEFYGMGLETPWTDVRTYWLVSGQGTGNRVPLTAGSGPAAQATGFPYTVQKRDRTIFIAGLKNGEAENFFGAVVGPDPLEMLFDLSHLDGQASENAELEVKLQGATEGTHDVQVEVNGVGVGSLKSVGQGAGRVLLRVPQGALVEGENRVRLTALGGDTDLSVVDEVRLTYRRQFVADGAAQRLTLARGEAITLGGFASPGIRVVDVTNADLVQEIAGSVAPLGGGYAITVTAPGSGTAELLAFTEAGIEAPANVSANQPSGWHEAGEGADVVILSHGSFLGSLQALKSAQEQEGWKVALVNVEDIYDEFSYGAKTPWAIRDFLLRARSQWRRAPRFLLLVGDASIDPKNYLGMGDFDYMPTKLVETAELETASDDWYADFDGEGVPQLAVGRLSVRTPAEAAIEVGKIVSYRQAAKTGSWTTKAVLVADQNDVNDYEAASARVKRVLPAEWTVHEVFRGQTGDPAARAMLLAELNEGALAVNYIGHGSVDTWRGNLLTSGDAPALANGGRLPLYVMTNCLNGYFHDLYSESLAESLMLAAGGGAVGVWASTGLTDATQQIELTEQVYRNLKQKGITVGEAILRAKAAARDGDVRRTWVFLGDPTLRVDMGGSGGGVDLALEKSHAGKFAPGATGVYWLAVTNAGVAATTGTITVTDTLPAGMSFVSGSGSGWSFAAAGQTVTCTYAAPLGAGTKASLALTVAVAAGVSGTVTNTARLSAAGDTNPANDSASDVTAVGSACDVNGDGALNVLDLQALINVINGRQPCPGSCDLNHDGSVNVLDLQALVNVILGIGRCP